MLKKSAMTDRDQAFVQVSNRNESIRIKFNGNFFFFPKCVDNRFVLGQSIDKGSFGAVYDCLDKSSNKVCVIKVVSQAI